MTVKLLVNGSPIAGVSDPLSCRWDDDPVAERTHSGVVQSLAFVGVTYGWPPLGRTEWAALNAAVDGFGGKIATSITAIPRDYSDLEVWSTFTIFDGRGIWPERPRGRPENHLIVGDSPQGGPTWHVAHVAPARV